MSASLISMSEDRPMVPPAATSRLAWRSRIRSMALRMLRALANRGCDMRSATYSANAAWAGPDS